MSNNIGRTYGVIPAALDRAFARALKQETDDRVRVLDIDKEKMVIFSDQHKGNRDDADDFLACERAYNAALAYYHQRGYTLAVLGDVEELWEERAKTVIKAYPHTLDLEAKFHHSGRYLRFWGNHDDAWSHADLVDNLLAPALGGGPLKVYEGMILHVRDEEAELGRILLLHGHQGTLDSDTFAPVSRVFVRYIWRPIQRLLKVHLNTPAKDYELRHAHNIVMYSWSEAHEKLVLIAGHTHRPVFKSMSHEDMLRASLQEAEARLAQDLRDAALRRHVAELGAELEWVLSQEKQSPADGQGASAAALPLVEFRKPSYFNTGCCCYLDGDITGLEISEGEIRLVRWPDDEDRPQPKVLASAKLIDVFAAC